MRLTVYNKDGDYSIVYTDGDPGRTPIALRYITDAYAGEPLFCVRGRDRLAVPAAMAYADLAKRRLSLEHGGGLVVAAVNADITALREWQAQNPDLLKWPDR